MQWVEFKIQVSSLFIDAVTNRLFELGAQGVTEAGTPENPILQSYFDPKDQERVLRELGEYCESLKLLFPKEPAIKVITENLKDEKWAEKYKEFYKAQKLSNRFFLRPEWDTKTPIPEGMFPIIMDPGQAFGTGLHPSTQLSIKLTERVVALYPDPSKIRCIDIGTGTGILAMVAAKLGAGQVEATDIDPEAVIVAIQNCKNNACTSIHVTADPIGKFRPHFNIIISNILLETHRELASEYARLLKPGGQLILSGLLGYQKAELEECLTPLGFQLEVQEGMQEWAAYQFTLRVGA